MSTVVAAFASWASGSTSVRAAIGGREYWRSEAIEQLRQDRGVTARREVPADVVELLARAEHVHVNDDAGATLDALRHTHERRHSAISAWNLNVEFFHLPRPLNDLM